MRLYIGFFRALAKIIYGKISSKKFIWVRHNLQPHEGSKNNILYQFIIKILEYVSSKKLSHANYMTDFFYFPHPLYNDHILDEKLEQKNRNIDYLFFGTVARYKGLTELLSSWPKEYKLKICGACKDKNLQSEIEDIIKKRGIDVEVNFGFLTKTQAADLLASTKYVVLSHIADSMIVSGMFYHAISFGSNILVRDSRFGREVELQHNFCHTFTMDTLVSKLEGITYIPPVNVISEAEKFYGEHAFVESWRGILD